MDDTKMSATLASLADEQGRPPRATLTAGALAELASKDPALAAQLGMSPKRKGSTSISRRGIVRHSETGSPFDQTRCLGPAILAAGQEKHSSDDASSPQASSPGRPDPRHFLTRHSGTGGNNTTAVATQLKMERESPTHGGATGGASSPSGSSGSPRKKVNAARAKRSNPPNTMLRTFQERGELPIRIDHRGVKKRLMWTQPMEKVSLKLLLPIFFDGLREEEEPYRFIADEGVKDLLNHAGDRVADILPSLVMPIRQALATRRRRVMTRTLGALQRLVTCDLDAHGRGRIGRELVLFYRQILPTLNIFVGDNRNLGDRIDYHQRFHDCPGDLIAETLQLLEATGGPYAATNILYYIPTYEPLTASGDPATAAAAAATAAAAAATMHPDEPVSYLGDTYETVEHHHHPSPARHSPPPKKTHAKKPPRKAPKPQEAPPQKDEKEEEEEAPPQKDQEEAPSSPQKDQEETPSSPQKDEEETPTPAPQDDEEKQEEKADEPPAED